jgi:outer membrane protein TolC
MLAEPVPRQSIAMPTPPHPRRRRAAQGTSVPPVALLGAVSMLPLLFASCKSNEEHVADADREVYEIVAARRDELAAGGEFSIDPPIGTLRDRLLQGEAPEALDLMECLDVASENSRSHRTRREALYLAALDLTLERWNFSVQQNGTFGAFLLGTGNNPSTTAGTSGDLGFTKLFGTGLAVAGNIGVDFVRDISSGDGWDAISNLSLNLTQPLMRGFGRDIVMEPLTQAERDVLYEARTYERFRRTLAFDVAARFFNVIQQEDVLVNEIQNQERVIRLRERNEAFAEAGLLNEIQVDQARQDELAAESRVIDARRSLESQLDDLKLFLGLPIETELDLDAGDWLALESWAALEETFPEEVVIDVALSSRLDYLTQLDRVIDAERRVNVNADGLRTGLDLSVDLGAGSVEGDVTRPDRRNSIARIGLELDTPINRLPERNVYRASLIRAQAAMRSAEELADAITNDLRESLRRLDAARDNYEIQTGAVTLAVRRVESAELNLEAGRAETRDVLDSQRDLVTAQNSAAGTLTDYILSGLSLYRDMELIQVSDGGISIETAPLIERTTEMTEVKS